jgi:membrane protein DedA with SNARE-associated domain
MVVIAGTVAGMTLGGWGLYGIARVLGPRVLSVPLVNNLVTEERYGKAAAWFRAYGIGTLFLSKLVPGMHFCAVASAGILKMDWRAALIGILGSNIGMFAALAYIGKLTGDHWRQAYQALGTAGLVTVTALAAAVAAVALFKKFRRRTGK